VGGSRLVAGGSRLVAIHILSMSPTSGPSTSIWISSCSDGLIALSRSDGRRRRRGLDGARGLGGACSLA
jgi:hypothetical protein